jgi:hypothetical protein
MNRFTFDLALSTALAIVWVDASTVVQDRVAK